MQLSSMTGFARQSGSFEKDSFSLSWVWEIKSVNGKSLDLKVRLPNWLDGLSFDLRNIASRYFERGNLSVSLDIIQEHSTPQININQNLLESVTQAAIKLYEKHPESLAKPLASELLNVNGVLEISKAQFSDEEIEEIKQKLLADYEKCCLALQTDRRLEGNKIKTVLEQMVEKIADLRNKIFELAQTQPDILKQKLSEQIAELLEGQNISEERLAQEAVLLVNRADIREELDRLNAHIKTAHELLDSNATMGRRFDFLCQELNRETNTTCSKAFDINIINYGMELKAVIEQLREQIQNME